MEGEGMLIAAACCFGVSALMYFSSCGREWEAETLSSVIRVKELKELGELIGNKTSSLLVAVSGKVGSSSAFKCNRSGVWGVSLTENAKLVFQTMIEDGEKKEKSDEILPSHSFSNFSIAGKWKKESEKSQLSHKNVPWFLEDKTGRVNVVGYDPFWYGNIKTYVFDEPVNELFQRVLHLKGVKIDSHTFSEQVFEIGTPLRFFAKAFRDTNGTLTIERTGELSSVYLHHFQDGKSIEKVVSHLKSDSKALLDMSVRFQTVGAVICAIYVVHLIRRAISQR